MGTIQAVEKGKVDAEQGCFQRLRHPVARNPVKIDGKHDLGLRPWGGAKNAHATRLDQAGDGGRCAGDDAAAFGAQFGPVVGDKLCAMSHQLQAKRRLARTRRTKNENGARPDRDGRGVNKKGRVVPQRPAASDRQTDHEARAQRFGRDVGRGGADVLCPDHPAMCLDDLLGNGQTEARIVTEMLFRPL